ncbi:hypothetical protein QTP88_002497 [Uroleucon formosanum]
MNRIYDDQLLSKYFDVSVMDVVTALLEASERRYSIDIQPEVTDDGDEAFSDAMGDFLVSMVSAAVIAHSSSVVLAAHPCGTSEPQRGQAAPQEIGGDGDGVKTVDEPVDAGMQPAEAEESAKNGDAGCLDYRETNSAAAVMDVCACEYNGVAGYGAVVRCPMPVIH